MAQQETENIVIVGAGGHGREIFAIAAATRKADPGGSPHVIGILDDIDPNHAKLSALGISYLGDTSEAKTLGLRYLLGIGDPQVRRQLDDRLTALGLEPAEPLVHPTAQLGLGVDLSAGAVLFPFVSVTTNVVLGRHVHLSTHVAIAHDTEIGDYVSVFPGACVSGAVRIGPDSLIGTQSAILQGITIGSGCTIGAGATVVKDVPSGQTVVGTPAHRHQGAQSPKESKED